MYLLIQLSNTDFAIFLWITWRIFTLIVYTPILEGMSAMCTNRVSTVAFDPLLPVRFAWSAACRRFGSRAPVVSSHFTRRNRPDLLATNKDVSWLVV